MLTPARAIIAGAFVFALGGALLISRPFDQEGGRASAADPSPPAAMPVAFTGTIQPGGTVRSGTMEMVDGHREERGDAWAPSLVVSDPRLSGRMTYSSGADVYAGPDGPESFTFLSHTFRIENDEGAWQGSASGFASGSGEDEVWAPGVVVLLGEGGYDGMYAVFDDSDWGDIRGVIFPAGPPDAPTAP